MIRLSDVGRKYGRTWALSGVDGHRATPTVDG